MTYEQALQEARAGHDPERYEGRTWEELSLLEQESVLTVLMDGDSVFQPSVTSL